MIEYNAYFGRLLVEQARLTLTLTLTPT